MTGTARDASGEGPRIIGILSSPVLLPAAIRLARKMDILEFRYDLFPRETGIEKFTAEAAKAASRAGLRTLLTIRRAAEGGGWKETEKARLAAFGSLAEHFDIVDIELGSASCGAVCRIAKDSGCGTILSFHDFDGMPSDTALDRLLNAARRHRATWCKLAVTAKKKADVGRLASWTLRHSAGQVVTIAMGRFGAFGRYSMWLFGSRAVYGTLGKTPLLPGQLDVSKLKELTCSA